MKVLVVMNSTGVKLGGGIIQVIINYRDQLKDANIKFEFAINIDRDDALIKKLTCNEEKFYQLSNKKEKLVSYIQELYHICKNGYYDVIHVHGNSATMGIELAVAKICGIKKKIAHCHNSQCAHPKINAFLMPCFRTLYTDALACSNLAGEWLFLNGKFEVLHNAIDLDCFSYNEAIRNKYRERLNIGDDTVVIGHVGNINEQKNHEFLLKVFSVFQNKRKAVLLIIGDGPLCNNVKCLAVKLGVTEKVRLLGVRNDVEKWMQAMDIFVFPSKWEGLGMAVIEAQAAGLPVLASLEVPRDTNVSNKIFYLSLEDSEAVWSKKLEDLALYSNNRIINREDFISYDIMHERIRLIEIYHK